MIVEGGINDASASSASLARSARAVYAQLPGTVIVVGPTAPPSLSSAKMAAVDATLRTAAAATGKQYVSLLHALNAQDYAADRLHPNAAGERHLADAIRKLVA